MFTTLRSRLAVIAVPALLIAGSGALAQPAAAKDMCVGQISCVAPATWMPSLQAALDAAAVNPDSDRIVLSGGDFVAPSIDGWTYNNPAGPVEIDGMGIGTTVLKAPAGTKRLLMMFAGSGSSIHDLSVHLPQMGFMGTGVATNADIKQVAVDEDQPQSSEHVGVALFMGASFANSTLALDPNVATDGVRIVMGGGGGSVTNSIVSANHAVASWGGKIQRSWVIATDIGVLGNGGTTDVENSVIRINSATGEGIVAAPYGPTHNPVINADGITMMSGLAGAQTAVRAEAYNVPGETSSINLKNSVLRGFDTSVAAIAAGAGTSAVDTSWSDYDSTKTMASGNATISKSHISNQANAAFVNPVLGNYRLLASSPFIDAGDPSETQGLDMDGNPRVTDGNLDGAARRDIGAYEVPGPLPADPPSGGGAPAAGEQPAAAGQPVSGAAAAGTGATAGDTRAPTVSGFMTTKKTFAIGRARTAIAAVARGTTLRYSLSESAKVTIRIKRAKGTRAVGTLTRRAVKGANAVKFSGRIGKRALGAGRYVAILTATDAAGNRSAAKRVAFRVVAA